MAGAGEETCIYTKLARQIQHVKIKENRLAKDLKTKQTVFNLQLFLLELLKAEMEEYV